MANALPVLVPLNPLWQAEVERYGAGIAVDFPRTIQPAHDALRMSSRQKYPRGFYPDGPPTEAQWSSEAPRLLTAVRAALPAATSVTARAGPPL